MPEICNRYSKSGAEELKQNCEPMEEVVKNILTRFQDGEFSIDEAVCLLVSEFGRAGRILVIDERLEELDGELADMGYTVVGVSYGATVERIKQELGGRVLITRNGGQRTFC